MWKRFIYMSFAFTAVSLLVGSIGVSKTDENLTTEATWRTQKFKRGPASVYSPYSSSWHLVDPVALNPGVYGHATFERVRTTGDSNSSPKARAVPPALRVNSFYPWSP